MLFRSIALTACLVLLALVPAQSVVGQDIASFGLDADSRIAALEASVAELRHWRIHQDWRESNEAHVYSGYSFLFAKLHFHESFQAIVTDGATGTLNLIPFENSFELTPRVWVGYKTASGLGVRASYWNFDHGGDRLTLVNDGIRVPSATSTTVIFPASITTALPGDVLTVDSGLDASTVDLEGTWDARVGKLDVMVGGGIRYARVRQKYDALVTGGPVPNVVPASLSTVRAFEGMGPTASAQAKLPWRDTGLYAIGNARVSFLYGEKTLTRTVMNDVVGSTPPNINMNDSDEVSGLYGIALGGGWQRSMRHADLFVEGLYEAQLWTTGGAPTLTFSGFEGFSLNLGLTFYP